MALSTLSLGRFPLRGIGGRLFSTNRIRQASRIARLALLGIFGIAAGALSQLFDKIPSSSLRRLRLLALQSRFSSHAFRSPPRHFSSPHTFGAAGASRKQASSPLIQLGKTSLLAYWVHIQFVYGGLSILPQAPMQRSQSHTRPRHNFSGNACSVVDSNQLERNGARPVPQRQPRLSALRFP